MLWLFKHCNYNFLPNLWMERGTDFWVPGGNYWCHKPVEQVILSYQQSQEGAFPFLFTPAFEI